MSSDKIAIIGMACRFPGAKNVAQFWRNLRDGVESVRFFSKAEMIEAGVDPALLQRPNYVRANAILEDADLFDADFFGMTPREAEITDPQHRIFLTCAWEALEDAGYDPTQIESLTGVYAGAGMSSYLLYNLAPQREQLPVTNFQLVMGNNKDFVPTRVSYRLNLTGPSVNVNTACSTSLVAVHLACQGLLDFECDVALAGGVGIQVPQVNGYLYEEGGIVSPDGHCRPFDRKANGTVNGSGAGVVVLKRLEDAIADGDTVYGVVLGTAVNNDGSDKVGFTAPSVSGQAQVIAEAQAKAEVHPNEISYIEAHGTGTVLGDPIEMRALTQVFREKTQRVGYCAIGSVKSNFGHLDEAAGIAGLIKTVLALRHQQIPPSLHFETPNPHLQLESSPFVVNSKLREWDGNGRPRRAGVSSFGIGGTNAHVVLEEFDAKAQKHEGSAKAEVLVVSARTERGVETAVSNLSQHLQTQPEQDLADVAFTLANGRHSFDYRRAVAGRNRKELLAALANTVTYQVGDVPANVVFMFSGQGSQYVNMARGLYESEPVFRAVLEECEGILRPFWGQSLLDVIFNGDWRLEIGDSLPVSRNEAPQSPISQTHYAQPALFAIEYALAQLWQSWGVQPVALLGHSLGEYVAACVAGVFSLRDGLLLVAERGRLMQSCATGAMLAVRLDEAGIRPFLNSQLSLAAVNRAEQCVVSGEETAVAILEQQLHTKGVVCRRLEANRAFHSHLMEPILDSFARRLAQVRLQPPQLPVVSNVTGTWLTAVAATSPSYWVNHLRQTVRFADGVQTAVAGYNPILLEVGAGSALANLARGSGTAVLSSLPRQAGDDGLFVRQTVGQLWARGVAVDWTAFYAGQSRRRVSLPTYPFEAKRYWIDPPRREVKPIVSTAAGPDVSDWFYVPEWLESSVGVHGDEHRWDGRWLIFGDDCGLGEPLQQRGARVVRANCGLNRDEIEALLRGLAERPSHIVHFGGVGEVPDWDRLFFDWLYLVQALDALGWTEGVQLTAVTTHAQAITADDPVEPPKAVLSGPLRVIPLEYPGLVCRQIDFDGVDSNILLTELVHGTETAVAYRQSQRFVPTLRQHPLPPNTPALRDGSVYLITGGMGSMGQAFAQYLAQTAAHAKIILTGRTPDKLLDPIFIAQREMALRQTAAIKTLADYGELPHWLDAYCASLILNYWAECGVAVANGRTYTHSALQQKLNLLPTFGKFYDFFVDVLGQDGLVQVTTEGVKFGEVTAVTSSAILQQQLLTDYPQFAGLIHYLAHCARHYRAALRGEIPAINVLYPNGCADELQQTEAETVEHRHDRLYCQLVADWLVELAHRDRKRPLRILEVGGGNGNLTLPCVAALAGHSVEYYFTDVGRSFVNQARETAVERAIDFMQFGILDISSEPTAQGFAAGSFDAIIGYNVVHAVADVGQTLAHLHTLLAPGGALALVETVNHRRWDTMIWGLAEGWWYFEDAARRLTPLLDLASWQTAVAQHFPHVHTFPAQMDDGDTGLIIAQKESTQYSVFSDQYSDSEVVYLQADVADREVMTAVIAQIQQQYGPINGVIHTAGVLGQGLIRHKTREMVEAVMAAKVTGTAVLVDLLRHEPLDFFLVCGSMSSIAPIAGQLDYSAANAYLDAAARALRREGIPATAVTWGFWQALGMIETADMPAADKRTIQQQIEQNDWSQAGVAAFARILADGSLPQVIVSPDPVPRPLTHPLFSSSHTDAVERAVYVAQLNTARHWLVDEHRLEGTAILPGTGYLEMVRATFAHHTGQTQMALHDVVFLTPLLLTDGVSKEVRVILQPDGAFHVVSEAGAERWVEHARGRVISNQWSVVSKEIRKEGEAVAVQEEMVLFGARWRCLRELVFGDEVGTAVLELSPEFATDLHHYALHPALLDMATGFLTLRHGLDGSLPFSYGAIEVRRPLTVKIISQAKLRRQTADTVAFDVTITDEAGQVLVRVLDYVLRRVETATAVGSVQAVSTNSDNFQLAISTPGLLDTLYFHPAPRQAPAAGEVEIEIVAAGLNFIEVLFALGMLPDPGAVRFGLECTGRIVRVGDGVTAFQVGDEVMAFAAAAFARFTTVTADQVTHKPPNLTLIEAATIPAVFTTAYYALVTQGRLAAGEKVLIHSASGGVGMAAVQIAQWLGAEIYATAGTPEKRAQVRALSVAHVFDSRSLAFADEVLAVTNSYGVDVVLNALGGEFIDKNLEILARYGRFLEIGKRDIFKNTQLDMRHFAKSLSFLVLDVGPDMPQFGAVWAAVADHFREGHFRPLPHKTFPMSEAAAAMQFMAQAQHVGKIVLLRDEVAVTTARPRQHGLPLAAILGEAQAIVPTAMPPANNGYGRPELSSAFVAPRTAVEQAITAVWQELLGIEQIGIHDDFFDLRGDSLLAAQVISRIHQVTGARLPVSAVFDAPTVAGLATMVSDNTEMEEGEI